MAFNTFVLDQLNNPPEELAIEILKILNATSYALPCAEIFKLSKEAVTSRDISLEMSKTLKPKGLVEIDRKERKPGVGSDIAFWKITQAGKDFLQSTNTKLPEDITPNYDPPIFGQTPAVDTVVAEIEKVIDTPSEPVVAAAAPDYSGKPKSYQILKYIEANQGATTKLLSDLVGTADIGNYVKSFFERGLVVYGKNEHGKRTWNLKEGWTAEQVYDTRKGGSNYSDFTIKTTPVAKQAHIEKQPGAKDENASTPQPPQETNDDIGRVSQALATSVTKNDPVEQVQKIPDEIHQTQIEHDRPAAKVRFAITSDRHMILMGLAAEDIELTEADSHALIKFCGDIALASNVSAALADRMIDLETLGS